MPYFDVNPLLAKMLDVAPGISDSIFPSASRRRWKSRDSSAPSPSPVSRGSRPTTSSSSPCAFSEASAISRKGSCAPARWTSLIRSRRRRASGSTSSRSAAPTRWCSASSRKASRRWRSSGPQQLNVVTQELNGIVLVTGPTGSGKSTTLAAIINQINREQSFHVITIEDPVEYLHRPSSRR